VPQDEARAAKWVHKAADQGNVEAQIILGSMYEGGHGVPQDYAAAVSWFRKAANKGSAHAQYDLGIMYNKGTVSRRTMRLLRAGFERRPTRETPRVKGYLGPCMPMVAACRRTMSQPTCGSTWRLQVETKGGTELRDRVANLMTPAQIAEAQKLAREWKPAKQPTR
jgi:uncharacterized protein